METLAYFHCASAYEETPSTELVSSEETALQFNRLKGKKFSSLVWLALLPIALSGSILGTAQEAQARGCCYCVVKHHHVTQKPKPKYKVKKVKRYKYKKVTYYQRVKRHKYVKVPYYKYVKVPVKKPKQHAHASWS